jgi:hypothetical protein
MASIDKRQSGDRVRYDVRYRLGSGEQRSKTFELSGDADEFRKKVERDELAGLVTDHRAGKVTLRDYAARWLERRVVSGRPLTLSTRQGYDRSLRRNIYPHFGATPLRRITPENVRE